MRQSSCLLSAVMARRDCRRAIIFRPEPKSDSTRTTVCFYSNHSLFLLEPRSASTRTTHREACLASTSAMVPWHETHRIGLPEDRFAGRTGYISPATRHKAIEPLSAQNSGVRNIGASRYSLRELFKIRIPMAMNCEEYTVLPVLAAGKTGVGSDGCNWASLQIGCFCFDFTKTKNQ